MTPSIEAPPETSESASTAAAGVGAPADRPRPTKLSRPAYPWWQRVNPAHHLALRVELSRAKHASLAGHPRIALALSRLMPHYEYELDGAFGLDGAPPDVVKLRRDAFARLGERLRSRAPRTLVASRALEGQISDLDFVNAYRAPFQFRSLVTATLPMGSVVTESHAEQLLDLDGNWDYDLGGSYGVNLFGTAFYTGAIERGVERARSLGVVLGPYHPVVAENVDRLRSISGLDEVSFHMSGTEAVMQAVRLARYHTGRSHVVRFAGAYHGWWDGVQAGPGNPRPAHEVFTLAEMSERTLAVLRARHDIACVLVNPVQAMHPNVPPPSDGSLVAGERVAHYDKAAYTGWLRHLRDVCTARGIVLIFDEVFLGFRVARGGVQEYFGVRADLVTYGKTIGGGLPVGVLCGRRELMRRFRNDRAADICFARGTFNSHPYVMTAMNEFLRHVDDAPVRDTWTDIDRCWTDRVTVINQRFAGASLPCRLANMTSVWTICYPDAGRYHWMYQFYLRAHGIRTAWIGTGRLIPSHAIGLDDLAEISDRMVAAGQAMRDDGWWWRNPELTARAVKRTVLRESVNALLGRASSGRSARP